MLYCDGVDVNSVVQMTEQQVCQGWRLKNGVRNLCAQEQSTILNTLTLNHPEVLPPQSTDALPQRGCPQMRNHSLLLKSLTSQRWQLMGNQYDFRQDLVWKG